MATCLLATDGAGGHCGRRLFIPSGAGTGINVKKVVLRHEDLLWSLVHDSDGD